MTIGDVAVSPRLAPAELVRWSACLALVMLAHRMALFALNARREAEPVEGEPVVMIELAPIAVAPTVQRSDLPPGPQQPEAEPTPPKEEIAQAPEKIEPLPRAPAPPDTVLAPPPEPKKEEQPSTETSVATAPPAAEAPAPKQAAPAPGLGTRRPSPAVSSWQARLMAHLQHYKRYPADARAHRDHGTARLAFSIERQGRVLSSRIMQSSGSAAPDREALALIKRTEPFPPPPAEVQGSEIPFTVPIRYNVQ